MKYLFIILLTLTICCVPTRAQCPVMPVGLVCISQATANAAAENKRELDATKAAYEIAKAQLIEKDKIIQDNQAASLVSINALKQTITDTEVKLGTATGQVIQAQGEIVRDQAMIQFLLTNGRKKCGTSLLCVQF